MQSPHHGPETGSHDRLTVHPFSQEGHHEGEEQEQHLLAQIAHGDTSAFWQLWEQYRGYLYKCCLVWMNGNREDAEDALSSAALKALDRLPHHAQSITNLKAWFTRLTHNLCVDIHRERQRHTRYARYTAPMGGARCEDSAHLPEHPEQAMLQRELSAHLCCAIALLPSQLREPALLRLFWELPYRDIAKGLTLSCDNVRKRVQQARAALQRPLQAYLSGKVNPKDHETKPERS